MMKRLLAVMIAATLMAGTAWGVDYYVWDASVGSGGGWKDESTTAITNNALPTAAVTVDNDALGVYATSGTDRAGTFGDTLTIGGSAGAGTLNIGANDTGVVGAGTVAITVTGALAGHSSGTTIDIFGGSKLIASAATTLNDTANNVLKIRENATLDLGTTFTMTGNNAVVQNDGKIIVGTGASTFFNGYTGSGVIDNVTSSGSVVISTAATEAGHAALGKIFDGLVGGIADGANAGKIGTVGVTHALAGDLAVAAAGGTVTLDGTQGKVDDQGVNVDVGGANLVISAASGTNVYGAVTAAAVTVDTTDTEFTGGMTADSLTTTKSATFTGGKSVLGAITASATGNAVVAKGSDVEVGDVTFSSGKLQNTGGTLTITGTAGSGAGLELNDAANAPADATAVTNLNSASAVALLNDATTSGNGGIGTVNINADGGNIALDGLTSNAKAGTVNFNAKQTDNNSAVDVGAATINFTQGATGSTFGTATITATGGINIGTGSDSTSVTFGKGAASTFGNGSKVTVKSGSTMIVGSAGATVGTGNMAVDANGVLELGGALTVTSNTIDFAPTAVLKAAPSLTTSDADIIALNAIANATVGGNAGALEDYLATFDTSGLTRNVAFGVDGTNIGVTITAVTNASAAVAGVMESQGVGDMTTYAAPFADTWANVLTTYAADPDDAAFTSTTGKNTAALIAKLGDGAFKLGGDARGAEAATNFLTGMDMAKSIDAAGQTAHRAVGNVFKRIQQNNTLRTAANDAFGSGSAYANSVLNADYANRFWLAGMGMWEKGDRYKGNAGFDYDAYGIQLGYDRVFGALTFGGSFAYANGDYEDKAALANDSEIENYTFNLYGTYNHCSGFFASIVGGYTYSDYDMKSSYAGGAWNKANYGMDTWTIGTTLGYDIRPVTNFTITPSVGLYYYNSKSDTFNSTGLNGIQIKSDRTELPLALSMKYDVAVNDCSTVTFEVNGGYTYNFSDKGGKVTALGYNGITGTGNQSTTLKASRHSYNVGAGISYNASRWDAGLKYDYYTSKASDAHVLRAEVGFKF